MTAPALPLLLRPLTLTLRTLPTVLALSLSDGLTLFIATALSTWSRWLLGGRFDPSLYWDLWPLLGVFLLAFWASGLYRLGLSPVDELRRLWLTISGIYLSLSGLIFLLREGTTYSRGIFLTAWLLSMALVWLGRVILRATCAHQPWWGHGVLILGAGKTGELVVRTLQRHPELGLKPIAILDDDPQKRGHLSGVPILGSLALAPHLAQERQLGHAIVAMPGVPRERLLELLERYGHTFPHLLMIPDLFGFASLWVSSHDLGGMLGLEIRQRLLLPGPRLTKAIVDRLLTLTIGLLLLPLIALIALAIHLTSPGPIFYGQTRLGKQGIPFTAWKFRSMVTDGDRVLTAYLARHPDQAHTWHQERKLKHDPRVTPIGRILRRTSLDELPQLWNVLRGDMSLVGPRPIVHEEIALYGNKFDLYQRVLPGITGLWQVSGRSDVTYGERVNLDAFYVRNWSVWLDLYILLRTVWVVLRSDGAY